jgi:hypothetical protein
MYRVDKPTLMLITSLRRLMIFQVRMRRQSVREDKEEEEEKEEETGEEKKKKEEVEDPDKIKPVVFIGLFITALFCLGLKNFLRIFFLSVKNFAFS